MSIVGYFTEVDMLQMNLSMKQNQRHKEQTGRLVVAKGECGEKTGLVVWD